MDPKRDLLRHATATIAYRGGKAVRDADPSFAVFDAGGGTRSPAQILAHVGDLFDWALTLAKGPQAWHDSKPQRWDLEVARFHDSLGRFDAYLASPAPLACPPEQLLQGPLADALTHVGQLVLLRRQAGAPIRSENYSTAEIVAGRVGPDQKPAGREF